MNMARKSLAMFLALCLLLISVPAFAAGTGTPPSESPLRAEATLGLDGKTVTVEVSVTNNPGFNGMRLEVSYDSAVFTLKKYSCTLGNPTPSEQIDANPFYLGVITAEARDFRENNALLFTYTFEVKGQEPVGKEFSFHIIEVTNDKDQLLVWPDFSCKCVQGVKPDYSFPSEASPEGDFDFLDGEIVGYLGNASRVVIPETIGGVKVTSVSASAFKGTSGLTFVDVPSTVTSIGNYAFYNCSALETLIVRNPLCTFGNKVLNSKTQVFGFKNAEDFVNANTGLTYVPLDTVVSADFAQMKMTGSDFRVVGSAKTLKGLGAVGLRVIYHKPGGDVETQGETHTVYGKITNYFGQELTGASKGVTYPHLYLAKVLGTFKAGETFTLIPYAIDSQGRTLYGEPRAFVHP